MFLMSFIVGLVYFLATGFNGQTLEADAQSFHERGRLEYEAGNQAGIHPGLPTRMCHVGHGGWGRGGPGLSLEREWQSGGLPRPGPWPKG